MDDKYVNYEMIAKTQLGLESVLAQELIDLGEEAGMALLKSRIEAIRSMCRSNIDRRLKK